MNHTGAGAVLLAATFVAPLVAAQEAPAVVSASPAPARVELLWTGPGCATTWNNRISGPRALIEFASGRPGATVRMPSVGAAVLRVGDRLFFTEETLSNERTMSRFAREAASLRPETVAADVEILVGPREIAVQRPSVATTDWLGVVERHAVGVDLVRVHAALRRYRMAGGESVLEVDWSGAPPAPPPRDARAYLREWGAIADVRLGDAASRVYFLGRRWGFGPRVAHELGVLRTAAGGETLLLHPGGLFPQDEPGEHDLCARTAAGQGPAVVVPRTNELRLGPDALASAARRYGLPIVAANVRRRGVSGLAFPATRSFVRGGARVTIVGLVDPDQLEPLPSARRGAWEVEDPVRALSQVVRDLEALPEGLPDVVVAVVASDGGAALAAARAAAQVDVVLGDFSRDDASAVRQTVVVSPTTPRSRVRARRAIADVRANRASAGRVTIELAADPERAGRFGIESVAVQESPIGEDGEMDTAMLAVVRDLEEDGLVRHSQIVLPDPAPIVHRHEELHPLVWGSRILEGEHTFVYRRDQPAFMTDPLWMRFVTNVLRSELRADVAIARNLPRDSSTVGPLQRTYLEGWLRANDEVEVLEVRGAELAALRDVLAAPAGGLLFAAGLDAGSGQVAGRPIQPARSYRIAVADSVREMPAVGPIFARATARGRPRLLGDVVMRQVNRWGNPRTGEFDPIHGPELVGMLLDPSRVVAPRWDLVLTELSLRGAWYLNAGDRAPFAATRETRVVTPDNFNLGAKLDVALLHDGPVVGWETRARVELQRMDLGLPGVEAQEAADDVLVSSELRLNATSARLGSGAIPLVPFARVELDSELTATPAPEPDQPDLPHQLVLREMAGVLLLGGAVVPELRLAAFGQHDFSAALVHDVGIAAGVKLALALGPVHFTSDTQARFLFDDGDDRETDLGMVVRSDDKLSLDLAPWLSFFLFGDVFLVRGKVSGLRHVAGSIVSGLGVQAATDFRL